MGTPATGEGSAAKNATLTLEKRTRLTALLEQRAALLQPSAELISRALRRCVRQDLRAQQKQVNSLPPQPAPTAAPPANPKKGSTVGAGGNEPVASPLEKTHGSGIPNEVARAQTMSDSRDDERGESSGAIMEAGREIGGYRLGALLGKGGMGQVYRAMQMSMNREVALKVLAPRFGKNPRFRERFLREARAAGRLHHPHLIAVHDVSEAGGLMFFSMELVEGSSVKELIARSSRVPEPQALNIVRQTLEALRYAHEHGIVHRDIKPDNLMLAVNGTVKIADLGLSRVDGGFDDDSFTTQAGTMMGTPYYMPPEQGRDAHRADARSDIYAVGATLYHMVCGKVPFEGETAMAIVINASSQPLRFPEPPPSADMQKLLRLLMAKTPAERPQTAEEALAIIETMLHGGGVHRRSDRMRTIASHSDRLRRSGAFFNNPGAAQKQKRWRKVSAAVAAGLLVAMAVVIGSAMVFGPDRSLRKLTNEVVDYMRERRYQTALGILERERDRATPGSQRFVQCEQLCERVNQEWDAWASSEAEPVFKLYRKDYETQNFPAAMKDLDDIKEPWRSPKVRAEIDRCENQIDAARGNEPPDRRLQFDRWVAGRSEGNVQSWWFKVARGANVASPSKSNEAALFSGTGKLELGSWPQAPRAKLTGQAPAPIGFQVRFDGPGGASKGDRWSMDFGDQQKLEVIGNTLSLKGADGPTQQLAESKDGSGVRFILACDRGEVRVGCIGDSGPSYHSIMKTDKEPTVSVTWSLLKDHTAEVRVGIKGPMQDLKRVEK